MIGSRHKFPIWYLLALIILCGYACTKSNDKIPRRISIAGFVQKGPFIKGTVLQLYELENNLSQTGNSFNAQITDNTGAFLLEKIKLSSAYVELLATGYYFNEVSGVTSPSTLALYAISDITNSTTINVNILTHLERERLLYLMKSGVSYHDAKITAQGDVLSNFGLNIAEIQQSEQLSITKDDEGGAILLALSVILQGGKSVGELTELLASITTDLQKDGILENPKLLEELRTSTIKLNLASIRNNTQQRFNTLGISETVPDFEKYISAFLAASGGKPIVQTLPATNIETTSVRLNASVNPNSHLTNVLFEYGQTAEYGNTIQPTISPVAGHSQILISADISNLTPGQAYNYRIKAENAMGNAIGNNISFACLGGTPIIGNPVIHGVFINKAIINVAINPNHSTTKLNVEYGTTTSYSTVLPLEASDIEGSDPITIQLVFDNLEEGTDYYYKISAENDFGKSIKDGLTFSTASVLRDIDGNAYSTLVYGSQTWMGENLKTLRFSNGDSIPNTELFPPITAEYQDETYSQTYGRLYTFNVALDGRNVCPTGWHVPTQQEWFILRDYLINNGYNYDGSKAGNKIAKSMAVNSTHWTASTIEGAVGNSDFPHIANSSNFGGLPAGRAQNYSLLVVREIGVWWTTTRTNTPVVSYFTAQLRHKSMDLQNSSADDFKLSIRCVKNN